MNMVAVKQALTQTDLCTFRGIPALVCTGAPSNLRFASAESVGKTVMPKTCAGAARTIFGIWVARVVARSPLPLG